jgi:hypothetical protein
MNRETQIARLKAAYKYWSQYSGQNAMMAHLHPPDLCALDPFVIKPYLIPAGFIPEYVGGSMTVIDRSSGSQIPDNQISKEFIMHNFLPGGFKKRWEFKHWRTDWRPSQHLLRAADITRTFDYGKTVPLEEIYSRPFFSPLSFPTSNTWVYFPETVYVYELQHAKKFYWNDSSYLLTLTREPGTTHEIMRDPLSTPLFENLILNAQVQNNACLDIFQQSFLRDLCFIDDFRVARCYYANCLEIFPKGQPLTRIIRFFNDRDNVHAIIATEHISQAVDFIIDLNKIRVAAMDVLKRDDRLCNDLRLQCIRVLMYRKLFYEQQLLESSYDVEWVCGILNALDYWMRIEDPSSDIRRFFRLGSQDQQRILNQTIPLESEIRLRLAGYTAAHVEQFRELISSPHSVLPSLILLAYDEQEFGKFVDDVICSTIEKTIQAWAQCVFNEVAEGLVFLHSLSDDGKTLHVYAYDTIQGGTGIAKEFFRKMNEKFKEGMQFEDGLAEALQCEVDISDAVIHIIFSSYDTHFLAGVFLTDDRTKDQVIRNALNKVEKTHEIKLTEKVREDIITFTKHNCARLSSSDDLIVLYHELTRSYAELQQILHRTPTIIDLLLFQEAHRFSDPRAIGAFEYFKTMKKGDLSEIYLRISEVLPVCINACPECLDIENHYNGTLFQSNLLEKRLFYKIIKSWRG